MEKEPKILIISEYFIAGDAITALNLFSKWDKNALFIASRVTDLFYKNFNSGYRIGCSEVRFRYPLSLFNSVPESNVIDCNQEQTVKPVHAGSFISTMYLRYMIPMMKWLGLFPYRTTYSVSEKYLQWIDEVQPVYIYTSVSSLNMAKFVDELMKARPQLRAIIHCYDDWVKPNYFTISRSYTKKSSDILRSIISRAAITLTSSEKMAKDYEERYGRPFVAFPNPVEQISQDICVNSESRSITFVGKILNHNIKSIVLFATALAKSNSNLTLDIYSDVRDEVKNKIKSKYNNTVFHGWVNHDDIPEIIRNSRILYLPISIDKQTIKFTKYSMSTKMSEYLSSGVPVLYQGPDGIAMTEMLEKYRCAFIVKNNDVNMIASTIKQIIDDNEGVKQVVDAALKLYKDKFEMGKVSNELKYLVMNN